jgi:hypothetical protein
MSLHDLLRDLEGIARAMLEHVGMEGGPVDLRLLADCYGIDLVPTRGELAGFLADDAIGYDETAPEPRQRFVIAHELGHLALFHYGWPDHRDEWAASVVAGALLCPERPFKVLVKRHGYDLERITSTFGCSWEVAARRIVETRSAILTIYDWPPEPEDGERPAGEITTRTQATWIHQPYAERVEPFEHAMIEEALRERAHVWHSDLCRAFYVAGADGWERVIVLVELEAFEEQAAAGQKRVG